MTPRVDAGAHKRLPHYQLIDSTADEFEPKQQHISDAKNAKTAVISVTWEKKPPSTSALLEQKIAGRKRALPYDDRETSLRTSSSKNESTCFK